MMKFLLFPILLLCTSFAHGQMPDFSMRGYATLNGGTTGGAGGEEVRPTNFDELLAHCTAEVPYVILIDREIKGSNPDETNPSAPVRRIIRMASNKTLLGVGDRAFLNQISLVINSKQNIIIRNIRFTMKDVPVNRSGSEVKILGTNSDPDIISISADLSSIPAAQRFTRNIWIDHCEFYNEDPRVMTDQDRYDGLVDVKNDVQYLTISWCYFHDHHKGCLSGSGSSDDHDRKTTMHHNYFDNIISRTPLLRFGKLHLLNNYVVNCENGLNVRIQSQAVVEKNYFKDTKKPIFGKPSEGGRAREIDNFFDNCQRLSQANLPSASSPDADPLSASEEYATTDCEVAYDYAEFVTEVADVPALVFAWSGVGKLGDSTTTSTSTVHPGNLTEVVLQPTVVTDELTVAIEARAGFPATITITDMAGKTVLQQRTDLVPGGNRLTLDVRGLSAGLYLCGVVAGRERVVRKFYR